MSSAFLFKVFALVATLTTVDVCHALDIKNNYHSPRNAERKARNSTELIVLHTTEAPERSSLRKVSDRGECNYLVTENGTIYSIIDREKEAFHAGRSMWNGKEDVDKFSIGVECVGYHDRAFSDVQLNALKQLVKELQKTYNLGDDRVISHSHVAYGAPNKWHKCKHRGRKRCGMLFAMPSVRAKLGLDRRPQNDPDVTQRRLFNADNYLSNVLYGSIDTMSKPNVPNVVAPAKALAAASKPKIIAPPPPIAPPAMKAKNEVAQVKSLPDKSKISFPAEYKLVTSTRPTLSAPPPLPPPANKAGIVPVPVDLPPVAKSPVSIAELKRMGYQLKGLVGIGKTASHLAGSRWNSADTYYTIRNKVISGTSINPARIEKGMGVWMKEK